MAAAKRHLLPLVVAAVLVGGALSESPSRAQASAALMFEPVADAFVSSTHPKRIYGAAATLEVDAGPTKQSFIRFTVSGVGDRPVGSAVLRLHQVGSSRSGGRLFEMTSNGWTEATTWRTRPAIDGPEVSSFGHVSRGTWYEVDITGSITGDGTYSFALDSTSSDGSDWSSSESQRSPRLVVAPIDPSATPTETPTAEPSTTPSPTSESSPSPPVDADGVSEVAPSTTGSSDPTYFNSNHRLARTSSGRLLTVYGLHARGVRLAWKDPGGGWETRSTGASTDGVVHDNGYTGDRPASIAVARDAYGVEHAWVVWSGPNAWAGTPLSMSRITALDSVDGPHIGPEVTVDAPLYSAYKPDIAFEQAPDGTLRGCILYSRRTDDSTYQLTTTWFSDLSTDTPAFHDRAILTGSVSATRFGTLVPTSDGLAVVARVGSGRLRMFGHNNSDAPSVWWSGSSAASETDSYATPSATTLPSGEVIATVTYDSATPSILVQRFSADGSPSEAELTLTGYREPTLVTHGTGALLVMVRASDGLVVSRELTASGWSHEDRVEIGHGSGGGYQWPNAIRQESGKLRFVVRGPAVSTTRTSVLAYQRTL